MGIPTYIGAGMKAKISWKVRMSWKKIRVPNYGWYFHDDIVMIRKAKELP